jgi:drug/metabolite transporter (DMT)-like permease
MNNNRTGIILSYLTIYFVWGSTYLGIKWAVETIPPFYLVGFRFISGGIVFIIISIAAGRVKKFPEWRELASALFLGVFLLLLGNGFITWAEERVDSYLASLIVSSTPFCIAFFNWILFKEKLSRIRLTGMLMGVLGVGLILQSGNSTFSFSFHLGLILIGFICWSFATSMGHKLPLHKNNLFNSGMQMLFVGVIALTLSYFIYKPLPVIIPEISIRSWGGLLYLSIFGAAGFYAYNYLLVNEPAIRISSYAIVNPLIAVLLGVFAGNEKPTMMLFIGMPVILGSLVCMMYGETILSLFKHQPIAGAIIEDNSFDATITEE